ncbi:MAG: glycosyltransferase family 2 protein [Meiothermus sp.]|uniref:glycosyltransferase family 2 protein n=2 Tax=Meiothermus sp. TaxID=1955249 RepID=UPI0025DEB51D|nr:glycosyltransferase family 2 protein [Meiothermus sp.]MCS7069790.1 glycosyltransferase family 2 protein [Meiothermus sp.]
MSKDFSIIVISHNTLGILDECLKRIEAHYPEAETLVVDTASTDGSPDWVEQNHPNVRLLRVPNRGYAFAVNRGLEAATRPYVVEMNSDVYLNAGDLEVLQQALQAHPGAALAGPALQTPAGRLQSHGPLYAPNYWNLRKPRAVRWVSGALIMTRKGALEEIGGMDERFFFYNEDLEWCTRARRKGWQVLLVPRRVLHLGGSSTPQDPRFLAEGYRGGLLFSRDYYPALHGLHQKAVWLEARLRIWLDPDPTRRAGYRMILDKVCRGGLDRPLLP